MEVKAAKLEGIAEARHVVERERSQLQQEHQVKLSQLKGQEQQVFLPTPSDSIASH